MALLSPLAVAQHAARAGFRGAELVTATAVGLGESGGNANARHVRSREDSRGIWQINIRPDAHPEYAGADLYDPATNAAAAYAIWKDRGWREWGAYTDKRYLLFLPVAGPAAAAASSSGAVASGAVGGVVIGGLREAAGALPGADVLDTARSGLALGYKAGVWLGDRRNWLRIAYVIGGGALMIGALVMIARPAIETAAGGVAGTVTRTMIKGARK